MPIFNSVYGGGGGGGGGWTPGENTIGYWKLENNTDATVGTTTSSNNVTFTTLASGKKVAVFNGSNSIIACNALATGTDNTYSVRCQKTGTGSGEKIITTLAGGSGKKGTSLRTNTNPRTYMNSRFTAWVSIPGATDNNTWYHIVVVQNSSGSSVYLNGTLVATDSHTGANSNPLSSIGCNSSNMPTGGDFFNGYISEVIVENKARTAQEVSYYYNSTKSNYGL